MKLLNLCFSQETMELFSRFPSQTFDAFQADPSNHEPTRLMPCGLSIGGRWYLYGQEDEKRAAPMEDTLTVTIFRPADKKEIRSRRDDIVQETVPVGKKILSVTVVNEKNTIKAKDGTLYQLWLTRAFTFTFSEGHLTFRKPVYFSPFFNIETEASETTAREKEDPIPEEWKELFNVETEEETFRFGL